MKENDTSHKTLIISLLILYIGSFLILEFSPVINLLFSFLRIVLFLGLFFRYYIKYFHVEKYELLTIAYFIFVLLATYSNSGHVIRIISYIISVFSLLVLFKYFNYVCILRYSTIIFSVFVYLNFILTAISPTGHFVVDGKPAYLFANNYNGMGPILLIAILSNGMYSFIKKKYYFNLFLLILTSFSTVLIVSSMTSAVGIVLLTFGIIFVNRLKSRFIIKSFLISVLVVNFVLLYLQTTVESKFILWFIEDILGKNSTFSSRTIVWYYAIELFKESPWVGYGMQGAEWYSFNIGFNTAHNFILELLLNGGLVLSIIFIFVSFVSINNANKNINKVTNVLQFGCCTLMLMMVMETYSQIAIFYLLFLNYYSFKLKLNAKKF